MISVAEGDFETAFYGEGDSCCAADSYEVVRVRRRVRAGVGEYRMRRL